MFHQSYWTHSVRTAESSVNINQSKKETYSIFSFLHFLSRRCRAWISSFDDQEPRCQRNWGSTTPVYCQYSYMMQNVGGWPRGINTVLVSVLPTYGASDCLQWWSSTHSQSTGTRWNHSGMAFDPVFYSDPWGKWRFGGKGRKSRPRVVVKLMGGAATPCAPAKGSGSAVSSPAGFRAEPNRPRVFHYSQHSGWPLLVFLNH